MLLHIKFLADHGGASGFSLGDLMVIQFTVMINLIAKSPLQERKGCC